MYEGNWYAGTDSQHPHDGAMSKVISVGVGGGGGLHPYKNDTNFTPERNDEHPRHLFKVVPPGSYLLGCPAMRSKLLPFYKPLL